MNLTPNQVAEERVRLATEYSSDTETLIDIRTKKAQIWNDLRVNFKSDTATERAWQGTLLGIEEMKLGLRMKASEKMMSALKSQLEVMEGEARNSY